MEPASQKETSPLDCKQSIHCLTKAQLLFPNAKNNVEPCDGTINAKIMWSYMMNQVYETILFFWSPTRRSLYETSLYPQKNWKEPHSLTSSTTSRACSAPYHKMISIK